MADQLDDQRLASAGSRGASYLVGAALDSGAGGDNAVGQRLTGLDGDITTGLDHGVLYIGAAAADDLGITDEVVVKQTTRENCRLHCLGIKHRGRGAAVVTERNAYLCLCYRVIPTSDLPTTIRAFVIDGWQRKSYRAVGSPIVIARVGRVIQLVVIIDITLDKAANRPVCQTAAVERSDSLDGSASGAYVGEAAGRDVNVPACS